ncbi:MAG: glycoside hydrolase family 3 N-terminal domain-containing protein [Flavobacteriaceae bacterium]
MKNLLLLTLSLFVLISCENNNELKYLNKDLSVEERLDDIMKRMTLEEKVAQMTQFVGLNYITDADRNMTAEEILNSDSRASYPGLLKRDIAKMVSDGKIGSFLHVLTLKEANRLQELAQKSRLKIPLLIGIDAIHGNGMVSGTTVYPSPISLASTFDEKIAYQIGKETAIEVRAFGSHWSFTPNIDVLRDPRWGRVGETFGEDPYLVGNFGVEMIKGLQSDDFSGFDHVIACAKHFAAGSEPVNGLNVSPMDISERTLREIYLKPFKRAVDAGVYSVMAAHNEINGIPSHMHKELLTSVMRDEFKFDGFYVSDWLDINRISSLHRIAKDFKEAIFFAVDAGMDLNMHGPNFLENVVKLVEEGKLSQERIDFSARKILYAKFKLGLFENPFVDPNEIENKVFTEQHKETALNAARKSIVLLKNDGILPISKNRGKKILVTGPNANNHSVLGDWVWAQPEENVTTIYEGINSLGSSKGFNIDFYDSNEDIRSISENDIKRTVNYARNYDQIVVVVGDNSQRNLKSKRTAGENMGRANLNLAGKQLQLVKKLNEINKNVIVIYVNGKPIAEPWIDKNISGIIESWESGSMAGNAVADVLFGDFNPGGKLPLTFPRSVGQLQMIYNHKPSQYFHKYAFEKVTPLYPFGHGLSYSNFEYSELKVNGVVNDEISISVSVTNDSDFDGEEVVQLYFRDSYSSVTRPVKELVRYKRVLIGSGETVTVDFKVDVKDLAFYDIDMNFCVEMGEFEFMVGGSSNNNELISETVEIKKRYDY